MYPACSLMLQLLESGDTRQRLLAVGTIMYHILAVRDAERNEATSQQQEPANIARHSFS